LDELLGNLHWCCRVIASAPHLIAYRYLIPSLIAYGHHAIQLAAASASVSSSSSASFSSSLAATSLGEALNGRYGYVWSHCDLNSSNILVNPITLQITAILDWEKAHIASPVLSLLHSPSLTLLCHLYLLITLSLSYLS
jgi:hypothetical protein